MNMHLPTSSFRPSLSSSPLSPRVLIGSPVSEPLFRPSAPRLSRTDTADLWPAELNVDWSTVGETTILRELPADLRTGHWYADLHHAMFLILLSRADEALEKGARSVAEYYLDTLLVYWLVHSLMEEEGLAQQITQDQVSRTDAAQHAAAHVMLTRWLWNHILHPFKQGSQDCARLRQALGLFFGKVVTHIQQEDQADYGHDSLMDERAISRQIAHLAVCGLPLSPQMTGSAVVARKLAPIISQSLSPAALAHSDTSSLKPLQLVSLFGPLWNGGKGAFRDVFLRKEETQSPKKKS